MKRDHSISFEKEFIMGTLQEPKTENLALTFARRLSGFRNSNAVIICTSARLMKLAQRVADILELPLDIVPCRSIADPANRANTIGSVSVDDVMLSQLPHDFPQDYLWHQISLIRFSLNREAEAFHGLRLLRYLWTKEVIILCDAIESADSILASISSVSRMMPSRIIVAAMSVNAAALRTLGRVVDEIISMADLSVMEDIAIVTLNDK